MIKEKYSILEKEYSINVTNNIIDSTRNKNISKTGFRAIKDGLIGTAAAIGSYDEEKMWTTASNNLSNNVPYDIDSSASNIKKIVKTGKLTMTNEEFYSEVDYIISTLKEKYPEFIFSNKASMKTSSIEFSNNLGTELSHTLSEVLLGFLFKKKSSSAIMDGYIVGAYDEYSREEFLTYSYSVLDAFMAPECTLENGTYPVIFNTQGSIMTTFLMNLDCESFMSGASLFSNKMNEKVFNDKFTFCFNTSPEETYTQFFDAEGAFNKDYKFNLIENGVIKTPFTSKAAAKKFDLKHTCSAFGNYDDIPSSSPRSMSPFSFEKTHDSLESIVAGEKSIYVAITAGGSYTPDGSFGAPVQVAFLVENGKVIGKLPEFSLSSHVFEMFGDRFKGVCPDAFQSTSKNTLTVLNMEVNF